MAFCQSPVILSLSEEGNACINTAQAQNVIVLVDQHNSFLQNSSVGQLSPPGAFWITELKFPSPVTSLVGDYGSYIAEHVQGNWLEKPALWSRDGFVIYASLVDCLTGVPQAPSGGWRGRKAMTTGGGAETP